METKKVVVRCTVYGVDGKKLFHVDGPTIVDTIESAQTVLREGQLLDGRMWQFEKIYPESAAAQFRPPDLDDNLETFVEDVVAIVNASNQV